MKKLAPFAALIAAFAVGTFGFAPSIVIAAPLPVLEECDGGDTECSVFNEEDTEWRLEEEQGDAERPALEEQAEAEAERSWLDDAEGDDAECQTFDEGDDDSQSRRFDETDEGDEECRVFDDEDGTDSYLLDDEEDDSDEE
ncbi:hypothetical protein [Botrimarina hoheduenensis]|uniref:Uncharacterized protein n=1 Tax=Botrimarina hoheduenensis TaxID=2528000 RepID=A0A5C5WBT0_9BACT|nr:hypothetical protein [Botrimarina hoheduenensis]TWT48366.1 hypothetical protein Pla111_01290 [Botrimarina hoheduenensis]